MLGAGALMGVISAYQMGLLKHLADPPLPHLHFAALPAVLPEAKAA